jgi:hypothetical protein
MDRNTTVLIGAAAITSFALGITIGSEVFPRHVAETESIFFRYQTLVAGIVAAFAAIGAALYAWNGIQHQIRAQIVIRDADRLERQVPALRELHRFLSLNIDITTSATSRHDFIARLREQGMHDLSNRFVIREQLSRLIPDCPPHWINQAEAILHMAGFLLQRIEDAQSRGDAAGALAAQKEYDEAAMGFLGSIRALRIDLGMKATRLEHRSREINNLYGTPE